MAVHSWIMHVLIILASLTCLSFGLQCSANCDYDEETRYANCTSRGLNCIPSNYPEADIMDLKYNEVKDITRSDFTGLQQVRVLNLDDNMITGPLESFIFYELDEIEVIYLRNNFLRRIRPYYFNRTKLSSVFLDNNEITSSGPSIFFSDAIEYLSLDNNNIENFDSDIIFEKLRGMSLRYNDMKTFDMRFLKSYPKWKPVAVTIDHNSLTSVSVLCFDLAFLDISLNYNRGNNISVSISGFDFIALKLSMTNIGLNSLDKLSVAASEEITLLVSHNRLRDLNMVQSSARNMRHLTADYNLIEVLSRSSLQDMPELLGLSVAYNAIHTISPETINSLGNLEYLNLRGNRITDVTFLDNLLSGMSLQELELENNPLNCSLPICNFYMWLIDHPPNYSPRCNTPTEHERERIPDDFNVAAAGCENPGQHEELLFTSCWINFSTSVVQCENGEITAKLIRDSNEIDNLETTPSILTILLPTVLGVVLLEGAIFIFYLKFRKRNEKKNGASVAYHKRSAKSNQNEDRQVII